MANFLRLKKSRVEGETIKGSEDKVSTPKKANVMVPPLFETEETVPLDSGNSDNEPAKPPEGISGRVRGT